MSSNRLAAAEVLRERIQQAANSLELGVRIFFVGVQDIHPPVKVAGDYEKVVGARQTLQAKMLDASADAFRTNSLASARAFMVTNDAMALRQRLVVASLAKAVLFTNQIPAFEAAPAVYRQRVYFQNLGRAVAGSRKYVLLTTNTQDVIVFDLQDKIREDLLNMSVTPTRK
jgi:membrane protease subunit HflK